MILVALKAPVEGSNNCIYYVLLSETQNSILTIWFFQGSILIEFPYIYYHLNFLELFSLGAVDISSSVLTVGV